MTTPTLRISYCLSCQGNCDDEIQALSEYFEGKLFIQGNPKPKHNTEIYCCPQATLEGMVSGKEVNGIVWRSGGFKKFNIVYGKLNFPSASEIEEILSNPKVEPRVEYTPQKVEYNGNSVSVTLGEEIIHWDD